jgi:hypothetical protein
VRRVKDPHVVGRSRHLLVDIIVLAICGVIADCDDWPGIVLFAQKRLAWFQRFLKLLNGVPSHDIFERVFAKLEPRSFQCCCLAWLRAVADVLVMDHIAIDGKTLCGSAGSKWGPLHLVSAWATEANLTLGQVAVEVRCMLRLSIDVKALAAHQQWTTTRTFRSSRSCCKPTKFAN